MEEPDESGEPEESEFRAELDGTPDKSHFAAVYDGDPSSRIVRRTAHLAALVDLSPLTAGHLLIVPEDDVASFADLPQSAWEDWSELKAELVATMTRYWAAPSIFEHGSSDGMRGSACIVHAHLHLVPGELRMAEAMEAAGLVVVPIADHRGIAAAIGPSRPYFYAESANGEAHVAAADEPSQPSQFLRQLAADALGLPPDAWDWGVSLHRALLRATVAMFDADEQ